VAHLSVSAALTMVSQNSIAAQRAGQERTPVPCLPRELSLSLDVLF